MTSPDAKFRVRLAESEDDIRAAQRLRYEVFVKELGGTGLMVDHEDQLERDRFDPFFDHLLLEDPSRDGPPLVGVYRVLRDDQAKAAGQFYSEDEYDLTALRNSGRKLLELGRSCLHPDYRGGMGMYYMWQGLSEYVDAHGIELLFGVASFHGTDVDELAHALSTLHHRHLAPPEYRVRARQYQPMDLIPKDKIDRRRAMVETPALIKAYLRLGGFIGDGAFVDRAFNTTDVCLLLDTKNLNDRQRAIYAGGRR